MAVLSLTWKSPYVDKTVFILRRGPVSSCFDRSLTETNALFCVWLNRDARGIDGPIVLTRIPLSVSSLFTKSFNCHDLVMFAVISTIHSEHLYLRWKKWNDNLTAVISSRCQPYNGKAIRTLCSLGAMEVISTTILSWIVSGCFYPAVVFVAHRYWKFVVLTLHDLWTYNWLYNLST